MEPLFILVCKFNTQDLSSCGITCSIGLGRFGIVFINKEIFDSQYISNELKDFIIAHEIANILHGHIVSKLIIVFVETLLKQALKESLTSLKRARNIIEAINEITKFLLTTGATAWITAKVDPQIVKQQELEADKWAIKLVRCRSVKLFANMLEWLRSYGYDISHKSLLGFSSPNH